MKKDTYERQKAFAGEKKPSMHRRCLDHDYQERQMYMLTLTTEGRRRLFGHLEGQPEAPDGTPDAPHICLTPLGQAVVRNWHDIPRRYPQIQVLALQMMPDHLHGILFVREHLPRPLGKIILGFKQGCNKAYRHLVLGQQGPEAQAVPPSPSAQPVQPVQSVAVLQQQAEPQQARPTPTYDRYHGLLFTPNYNDRLLLRQGQLDTWRRYLRDNPRRLLVKQHYPEFFRVHFDLRIGPYTFSALGNRFLLTHPVRLQVQCSRRLTDADIQARIQEALAQAALGAVHISPAISPGEKAVMRALLNARRPIVFLEENGLTPYTKPGGEFFEACARGQLLILSPWQHHNERLTITRNQCLTLNAMAAELCKE